MPATAGSRTREARWLVSATGSDEETFAPGRGDCGRELHPKNGGPNSNSTAKTAKETIFALFPAGMMRLY